MQLSMTKFKVIEFEDCYHKQVVALVSPIQQLEFNVPISVEEQPDLMNISAVFQTGLGNFWVAVLNGEVVGCVGLVDIGDRAVALKKMFVRADARGKEIGVSAALLERAKQWCRTNGISTIYLGSVEQMKAAHRFYEKNGFAEIAPEALPPSFPLVRVDTRFFVCRL